uniref:Uncharacterized protein n=1 Tax=Anguilla anguilla TaxID=7936 RepID=A0A0E9VH38_ANGAN
MPKRMYIHPDSRPQENSGWRSLLLFINSN